MLYFLHFRRPLPQLGWHGWWNKALIFSPHLNLTGVVIYLDLDTVICGDISFLIKAFRGERAGEEEDRQSSTTASESQSSSTCDFLTLAAAGLVNEGMAYHYRI